MKTSILDEMFQNKLFSIIIKAFYLSVNHTTSHKFLNTMLLINSSYIPITLIINNLYNLEHESHIHMGNYIGTYNFVAAETIKQLNCTSILTLLKSVECMIAGVKHLCFLIHVLMEPNLAEHNTVSQDSLCPPPRYTIVQ